MKSLLYSQYKNVCDPNKRIHLKAFWLVNSWLSWQWNCTLLKFIVVCCLARFFDVKFQWPHAAGMRSSPARCDSRIWSSTMQCHVKVTANTKSLLLWSCYRRPSLGTIVFLPQEEIPAKRESAMQSDCASLKVCKPLKTPSEQWRLGTLGFWTDTDTAPACLAQWKARNVCMLKCVANQLIILVGSSKDVFFMAQLEKHSCFFIY